MQHKLIQESQFLSTISFENRFSFKLRQITGWGLTDWRVILVHKIFRFGRKIIFWKKEPQLLFEIASMPQIRLKDIKERRYKIID